MAESFVGGLAGAAGGAALGTLYVELTAHSAELIKEMSRAELTVRHGVGVMLKEIGALSLGVTGALSLIGLEAVEQFAKFEKAMTHSTQVMKGMTAELRKEMEDTARAIAKESTVSAVDLASSYKVLAQSGLNAKDAMASLAEVSELAEAGELNAARAAQILVEAQAGLGLKTKDSTENIENLVRISDVLVKASTLATTSVEELGIALSGKTGAALRSVNKEVEEGVAILAVYADQGLKSGEASAALEMILGRLQKAGMENRQLLNDLGVTIFDSGGKMRKLADIVGDLERSFRGATDEEKKTVLGLLGFEQRAATSILPLIGMSDKLREFEVELHNAGGSTKEMADKDLKDLHSQLEITLNLFKDLMLTIGQGLAPAIKELNEMLKEFANVNSASNASLKETAGIFGTMLVGAVKGVIMIFNGWRDLMKLIAIGLANLAQLQLQVTQTILGYITAGVNALRAGLNILIREFNSHVDNLNAKVSIVRKLLDPFGVGPKMELSAIPEIKGKVDFGISPEKYKEAMATLEGFKTQLWDSLVKTSIDAAEAVKQPEEDLKKGFEGVSKSVSDSVKKAGEDVGKGTASMVSQMELARSAFDKLGGPKSALESMGFTKKDIPSLEKLGVEQGTLQNLQRPSLPMTMMGDDPHTQALIAMKQEQTDAENRLSILQEMHSRELDQNAEFQAMKEAAIKAHNERLRALQLAEAQIVLQAGQKMFEDLSTAVKGFAGEQSKAYMAMFAASKAFAIADASVKIAQGVANALSLPWPANIVAAASVVAAAASIISNINSIQLAISGEREYGGLVSAGKNYMVGEKGPEVFSPASNGSILPNDRMGGNVKVVINNYTDAKASVTERNEGPEKVIEIVLKRIKSEVASEVRDGRGEIPRAMESSYSLRRGNK